MDYIDNRLSAIEDILRTQSEEECRKNVIETIDLLKQDFPEQREYIDAIFKQMCTSNHVDFFKEIRISPNDMLHIE